MTRKQMHEFINKSLDVCEKNTLCKHCDLVGSLFCMCGTDINIILRGDYDAYINIFDVMTRKDD